MARLFDLNLSDLLTLSAIPFDPTARMYAQRDIEDQSCFIADVSPQVFDNLGELKEKMFTNVHAEEKPTKPVDSKEEFAQYIEKRCVSY